MYLSSYVFISQQIPKIVDLLNLKVFKQDDNFLKTTCTDLIKNMTTAFLDVAAWSRESRPTFQRFVLPPSSQKFVIFIFAAARV
jgi:hypothetical protein